MTSFSNDYTLTILGCGTMGTAVLTAIFAQKPEFIPKKIITLNGSEKSKLALKKKFGSKILTDTEPKEAIKQSSVVVLGLKPYMCEKVLNGVKDEINGKLVISLVAGWTIEQLSDYSPKIARVMTNTPAKFGHGMAAVAVSDIVNKNVNHELDIVNILIAKIGSTIVIPESKMDSATSLIGSGPAFVLLMIESMIDSGIKLGFTYDESRKSVLQVLEGTCKMVEATNLHPAILKTQVCTPGGTTINGLAKMEEKGIRSAIIAGVQEAKDVASALGKEK